MKKNYFFMLAGVLLCAGFANANALDDAQIKQLAKKNPLLTPRDLLTQSFSNVTVQNKTGSDTQVYGLYVHKLAYVSDASASCSSSTSLYGDSTNAPAASDGSHSGQYLATGSAGGAYVTSINFQYNQAVPIGQNYLYNMMFNAIFRANQPTDHTSPCALPGCTWADSDPPDNAPKYWCVYVGVLAPENTNTSSTSVVPPSGLSVNDSGYGYDLIASGNYGYIGPITCNDQTLTCSVSSTQNQSFPR